MNRTTLARWIEIGVLAFAFAACGGSRADTASAASPGSGNTLALQADGKVVTAGGAFTLTRHNVDGSLDTSFGSNGKVTTAFGVGSGTANDVAIQSDGKIVVAGNARARAGFPGDDDFSLRRYNVDGSLDASFGAGGVVDTDFAALADLAQAVAIQPDGKIVVAGQAQNASGIDFALARYNADGSLDAGFSGGKVVTDIAGGIDVVTAMLLQPDGKILLLGRIGVPESSLVGRPVLVRYNANGSLDAGFGVDGKALAPANGPADGMALQEDGKILVSGSVSVASSGSASALTRFLADGTIDPSFGNVSTRNGGTSTEFALVRVKR